MLATLEEEKAMSAFSTGGEKNLTDLLPLDPFGEVVQLLLV